jgi:hypothetical protein
VYSAAVNLCILSGPQACVNSEQQSHRVFVSCGCIGRHLDGRAARTADILGRRVDCSWAIGAGVVAAWSNSAAARATPVFSTKLRRRARAQKQLPPEGRLTADCLWRQGGKANCYTHVACWAGASKPACELAWSRPNRDLYTDGLSLRSPGSPKAALSTDRSRAH